MSHFTSNLHRMGLAVTVTAALALSACVESQIPLLTDAQPLLGQQFDVHLYENFVDGKAGDFHTAAYQWKDGNYLRGNGLARDAKRFVAQPLAANDFLLQSTDSKDLFNYWIGRKLSVGVYLIIPLDEADADDATRTAVCGKDQPEGIAESRPMINFSRWLAPRPPSPCGMLRLASC